MSKFAVSSAHLSPIDLLGERVEGTMTAEEALEKGRLANWNIRKTQAYAWVEGKRIPRPGMFDLIADDPATGKPRILGKYPVSESYAAIQNEQHAHFLNILADESGAEFELAGSMKNGEVVFLSMKMPGHVMVGGVDPLNLSLLAVNGHGGSMSFTLAPMAIRYACSNVLNGIHSGMDGLIRVRHTSGAEKNLQEQAREALGLSFEYLEAVQTEAEQMINTTMTQAQFEEIIEREFGVEPDASKAAVTRSEKKIEEICGLFADAQTQEGVRDTAWAGYNALTEWADHYSPARGEDQDASRAQRAILDPSFKTRALNLMMAAV